MHHGQRQRGVAFGQCCAPFASLHLAAARLAGLTNSSKALRASRVACRTTPPPTCRFLTSRFAPRRLWYAGRRSRLLRPAPNSVCLSLRYPGRDVRLLHSVFPGRDSGAETPASSVRDSSTVCPRVLGPQEPRSRFAPQQCAASLLSLRPSAFGSSAAGSRPLGSHHSLRTTRAPAHSLVALGSWSFVSGGSASSLTLLFCRIGR